MNEQQALNKLKEYFQLFSYEAKIESNRLTVKEKLTGKTIISQQIINQKISSRTLENR